MTSCFHPAKIGDIVYSLPAVHRRGGVSTYFIKRPEVAKYLKPLLESQPYIETVAQIDNPPSGVTIDFSDYQSFYRLMLRCDLISLNCMVAGIRTHQFPLKISGVSLRSSHVKYMNCDIDLDEHRDLQMWRPNQRWLTNIEPVHKSDIIINLTERYHDWNNEKHNPAFHFDYTLLKDYDCGFIGWDNEYDLFCDRYGFSPRHIHITNALDVAQYIRGSKLFVGAASSAKAIAEGLKHPTLMEISKEWPDDLPKHRHGHYFINKELIEHYLNNDTPVSKYPECEIKEEKEGLEAFF
tara:strand:- start:4175 stop:5059 length:885 start_codon:yes stop_codon:yes gene_type:complete